MHCSLIVAALSVLLCTIGVESKGPCLGHHPISLRPFAGVYVPQCTPFGYFKVVQVHGSTGHSWCVNPENGEKVESSDVAPGAGAAQCGKCFFELAKYYGAGHVSIGRAKPQCDAEGRFNPLQGSGSTGYSWCVNTETGEKIEGTQAAPGAGPANCQAREKRGLKGPCLSHHPFSLRPVGQFAPQCSPFGYFKVVQVHGSTGHSWCVNPENGEKVNSTDVGPGTKPTCGKCFYELAKFFGAGFISIPGFRKPQCDAEGNYLPQQTNPSTGATTCVNQQTGEAVACEAREKRALKLGACPTHPAQAAPGAFVPKCTVFGFYQVVQFHGSTGYKFCVHPVTGAKIEGTEVAPGDNRKIRCGKCLTDLLKTLSVGFVSVGRYIPNCDASGRFNPVQSSSGTGYSWCVNTETGEKIEGSEVAPGAGRASCAARKRRAAGQCEAATHVPEMPGSFKPKCTGKGNFELVQFHGSTGYSWCADPSTGVKIDGTETAPGQGHPACPACVTLLSKALEKLLIGAYRPQCDATGNFKKVQISASTGLAWCADGKTGQKIGQAQRYDGTLKCEDDSNSVAQGLSLGPCAAAAAVSRPLIGSFVPKCDNGGFYASIQQHEGFRFCVDTNTGIQLAGSPKYGPGDNSKLPCEN